MARVTVEDCLRQVNNRFALVHLATQRVRELRRGIKPQIESKNKEVVISLREVAANLVRFDTAPSIVRPAAPAPGAEGPDLKQALINPDED